MNGLFFTKVKYVNLKSFFNDWSLCFNQNPAILWIFQFFPFLHFCPNLNKRKKMTVIIVFMQTVIRGEDPMASYDYELATKRNLRQRISIKKTSKNTQTSSPTLKRGIIRDGTITNEKYWILTSKRLYFFLIYWLCYSDKTLWGISIDYWFFLK